MTSTPKTGTGTIGDIGLPQDFKKGVDGFVSPGETDNLTDLENLTEETMLLELLMRYKKDVIYTYVGDILCAINPFKMIPGIYEKEASMKYTGLSDLAQHPPHLFATADRAFQNMVENQGIAANQVCVISGESGAGKTESAKLFVKHIIYLSQLKSTAEASGTEQGMGLEEKIVQLNPLLEAYGNAQTLMNDNSSRFGKFTELRFNGQLAITGAKMTEYLLEKSRVIEQTPGERNFHIYYLFLAGCKGEREKYDLGDPGEHRIIYNNDAAVASIDSSGTFSMYKEVEECLGVVGFTEVEKGTMFHLLAGILHLGDVEFGGEDDDAYVVSGDDQLHKVANQLGVSREGLKEALVKRTSTTRGETVTHNFNQAEAEDGRDALAKAIYEKSFAWIIRRCNGLLGPAKIDVTDKSIAILDIFGFETFDSNSFEQLLINLANEQLQYFFNNHIFSLELAEYEAEGIDGNKVQFSDNTELLELMIGRGGMLGLCDEEAKMPRGTDDSMLEKFHKKFVDSSSYTRPKGNDPQFTIEHYAGKVTYDTDGFIEKNRDTLAIDVVAVMRTSEYSILADLFGGEKGSKVKRGGRNADKKQLRKSLRRAKADAMKSSKLTVGATFKNSLKELMDEMNASSPHFIRCIKPNLEKSANNFKMDLVTRQLRYTGMLETTRIRKEGYSHRPTFGDFLTRYKIIGFPLQGSPPVTSGSCTRILEKAGVTDWQVGRTKVFLRYYHPGILGKVMQPYPAAAADIQNACRGLAARREVGMLLEVAAAQAKKLKDFISFAERQCEGARTVIQALCDDDAMRPSGFFDKKRKESSRIKDPVMKKMVKKAEKSKAGISRNQSVKWFKEVEMKKGAAVSDDGDFELWFHGIISRSQAEKLLTRSEPGAFLVRVAESRFGYSLSHYVHSGGRIKHYMIDQTPEGEYQVVGNSRLFGSLNELVSHHKRHKIVATDPVCLEIPCGHDDGDNALAEMR